MENNNRPFFDPYMPNNADTSSQNINSNKSNNSNPFNNGGIFTIPNITEIPDVNSGITSATKYYEQQYMYYKYLTQVLDYKMKLFEYEKAARLTPTCNMQNKGNIKQ